MASIVNLHDRRRPFKIPESLKDDASQYVQTQTTKQNRDAEMAPFPRLVDFWFAGVMYAVSVGLEPDLDTRTVSPNYFGPDRSRYIQLEDWQEDLLLYVALADQQPLRPETADLSPDRILAHCNGLAVAGMLAIYAHLSSAGLDAEDTNLALVQSLYQDSVER